MRRTHLVPLFLSGMLVLSSCQSFSGKNSGSVSSDVSVGSPSVTTNGSTAISGAEDSRSADHPGAGTIDSTLTSYEGTGASSDGSASGPITDVKVNWDIYEPADVEENVYTRLSDTSMTDFIPSGDYGELIPYYARHMLVLDGIDADYEGTNPVGFFNEEGVLICDPIFDIFERLPNGDYLVGKFRDARAQLLFDEDEDNYDADEFDDAHSHRLSYLYRYGILAHDGSSYTGLIYDGYAKNSLDPNSDLIYLYTFEEKTTRVTPYRCSERKTEDPFRLSFTPDSYMILTRLNSKTIAVSSRHGEFGIEDTFRFDGSHPKMDLPEKVHLCRVFGTSYLYHASEEGKNSEEEFWNIYSFNDNKRLPHGYSTFCHITADRLLMIRTDGYDIVDGNGHITATLDNSEHKWTQVSAYEGYVIGLKDDALVIMDEKFKEIKTFANCSAPSFVLQEHMYTEPEERRFYGEGGIIAGIPRRGLEPIIRYTSSGEEYLYNIATGATYDCGAHTVFYQCTPGYIVCHEYTSSESEFYNDSWNPIGAYTILDAKDMHVIYKGEDLKQVLSDSVTGKTYLFHYRRNETSGLHSSLTDLETGKTVWETKDESSTPVTILPLQVVNGRFCYDVYSYEYELSYEDDHNTVSDLHATVMQDKDEQVLFRYKTLHLEDD